MKEIFRGCCTALITPFKDDQIDFDKMGEIIESQILAKVDAILVLGTTGESPTITKEERRKIIMFAKEKIAGRTKLIVGSGSNSTKKAVENSIEAEIFGADALLVVTPYYNKCTQNGLIAHYGEIAKNVRIPMIVYNVPSRTGVNIMPQTALRLSKIENICGIKEANSDLVHIKKMLEVLNGEMAVYSGNDDLNFEFLKNGATGVISVTSNLFPSLVKEVCELTEKGNLKEASFMQDSLQGLNKAMFIETNPIPVKYGANYMGLCKNELRLPLTQLEDEHKPMVEGAIDNVKNI